MHPDTTGRRAAGQRRRHGGSHEIRKLRRRCIGAGAGFGAQALTKTSVTNSSFRIKKNISPDD